MPGNFASACGAQTKVRMGVPAAGISMYEEVMITARSFQTLRHRRRVAEVYAKLVFS
jgi:hypothetical protein